MFDDDMPHRAAIRATPARSDPAPDADFPPLPLDGADPKPWYLSRGVIGALMVIIAQGAALFGVSLDASLLTEIALQALTLIGGLVALWGRLRAEQPIAPLRAR